MVKYEDELKNAEFNYLMLGGDGDNIYLFNPNSDENVLQKVSLNENEQSSLKRIVEAFGRGVFSWIAFDDNGIAFNIYDDDFAVVYSFDGKKPDYVRDKKYERENGYFYYVKKLNDNWYAITGSSV